MKKKPIICLIDDDPNVKRGWEKALGDEADVHFFLDHNELLASIDTPGSETYACVIMGRYFKHINLDVIPSQIPYILKEKGLQPLFLNWQGYVSKDDLNKKFDGKLFHRYGVKWQTLKLRIQKYEKTRKVDASVHDDNLAPPQHTPPKKIKASKEERCRDLLLEMAKNARGPHKTKIEHYAKKDFDSGVALLEAIYNRLITHDEAITHCPSQYINSSPIIAKKILKETLYC